MPFSAFDCGHYFSRYNTSTRWNEDNCHAECVRCNRMDTNHLEGYRENIIMKIGARRFRELESLHREMMLESDIDFDALIEKYKREARRLSKLKGIKITI